MTRHHRKLLLLIFAIVAAVTLDHYWNHDWTLYAEWDGQRWRRYIPTQTTRVYFALMHSLPIGLASYAVGYIVLRIFNALRPVKSTSRGGSS